MNNPSAPQPRIMPLATLPVFYRLHGRKVLVIGNTPGAAWKSELLASAGARVTVITESQDSYCQINQTVRQSLIFRSCPWQEADLKGMALVVADLPGDDEAKRLHQAARNLGVAVNIVDRPSFCDFQFGSIVNRSPLIVGISTDGAAPVFGQAIRARIEMLLPSGFRKWAQAARDWRAAVQAADLPLQARRRIWEKFVDLAFGRPESPPTQADYETFQKSLTTLQQADTRGRVLLVGAGPGDPELLTLKAVRALQSADVILHDMLVSSEVLDFARREAQRIVTGKTGHKPSCKQDDINRLMVDLALQGKRVVRLKGGDPLIFGRAGEEIAACRKAGIDVEIIPGITAASGAAATQVVSLTHRDHARRLQFFTAHSKNGKLPDDLDWNALIDPTATTAIYMGRMVVAEVAERLVAAGIDPATPAIIVENATRPQERCFYTTVSAMPEVFSREQPDGPCMILYGRAMSEYPNV